MTVLRVVLYQKVLAGLTHLRVHLLVGDWRKAAVSCGGVDGQQVQAAKSTCSSSRSSHSSSSKLKLTTGKQALVLDPRGGHTLGCVHAGNTRLYVCQ